MIIINDELLKNGKVNLDDGYAFGKALFETILVRKKPILLLEHLQRINSGLRKIGINQFITEEYARKNIDRLNCANCCVKIIVSDKNIVFIKREVKYKEEHYTKGFSVMVSEVRRNKYSKLTYLKSANYMDNILEREQALNLGYDESLFLNTDNEVCEGSISNIFFIHKNKLYTPDMKCGLLNGIIRQWVLDNYEVEEGCYTLEDLHNCQGIFITNSLMGIMKVSKINNNHVPRAELIDKIRMKYNEILK